MIDEYAAFSIVTVISSTIAFRRLMITLKVIGSWVGDVIGLGRASAIELDERREDVGVDLDAQERRLVRGKRGGIGRGELVQFGYAAPAPTEGAGEQAVVDVRGEAQIRVVPAEPVLVRVALEAVGAVVEEYEGERHGEPDSALELGKAEV